MSDHESDNYDSEPDIFEIIVSDSEDDLDMEDLFSAPATGTQNTTMDEECQVEEGVSRRRTVEGHHVSEDRARSTVFGLGRSTFTVETLLLKSGQVAMLSSTRPRGFTSGRRGK